MTPPEQVGHRPLRPVFLVLVGVMWIAFGVIELFVLDASWRFIPAIALAGIGLFFLWGAAMAVIRRDDNQSP